MDCVVSWNGLSVFNGRGSESYQGTLIQRPHLKPNNTPEIPAWEEKMNAAEKTVYEKYPSAQWDWWKVDIGYFAIVDTGDRNQLLGAALDKSLNEAKRIAWERAAKNAPYTNFLLEAAHD